MTRVWRHEDDDEGFTLVELLVVVTILGIISFALTEAVIVGFKTTDAVTTDVTRSSAVQILRSYFTADAQHASQAFLDDTSCAASAPGKAVVLHLYSTDQGPSREIAYSMEDGAAPVAGQGELVRRTCTPAGVTLDQRRLGLFEYAPPALPVSALCQYAAAAGPPSPPAPCPATFADPQPATITLKILTNRPKDPPVSVDLTVRRRTT